MAGTGQIVWSTWNYCTSGTDSTVWPKWCDTSSTYTSNSATTVWIRWNGTAAETGDWQITNGTEWHCWNQVWIPMASQPLRAAPIVQTPSKAELRRREKEERKKLAAIEVAKKVAEQLLLSHLDREQQEQYRAEKKFHVVSQEGRRYEVDCTRRHNNVVEFDAMGRRVMSHCIAQRSATPLADNALAQKLMLEADEKRFRRIANRMDLRYA